MNRERIETAGCEKRRRRTRYEKSGFRESLSGENLWRSFKFLLGNKLIHGRPVEIPTTWELRRKWRKGVEPSRWNDTGVKGVSTRGLNLWQADGNGEYRATEKLRKGETRYIHTCNVERRKFGGA
jgi:hypothetical protein